MKSSKSRTKKRVPLQEAPTRINDANKPTHKKPQSKHSRQSVATRIPRKDEYSLENLRAIFEDEENAATKIEFKATSTPFNSQLVNSQVIDEEQINNQLQLDLEINKIHDSINKESIMQLLEQLSPPHSRESNRGKHAANMAANNKPQKKQPKLSSKKSVQSAGAKHIPKPKLFTTGKDIEAPVSSDIRAKKNSKVTRAVKAPKKEPIPAENKRDQLLERNTQESIPKSKPALRCRTRLESKLKVNCKTAPKLTTKPKLNPNTKVHMKTSKAPRVRFKGELSYKELILKCVKGKDPMDLLV